MISWLILMKTKTKQLMSALSISLVLITNLILYLCQCFNKKQYPSPFVTQTLKRRKRSFSSFLRMSCFNIQRRRGHPICLSASLFWADPFISARETPTNRLNSPSTGEHCIIHCQVLFILGGKKIKMSECFAREQDELVY